MGRWTLRSTLIEFADKMAAAVLTVFAAAAAANKAIEGPSWISVVLAALGVLGALATLMLKVWYERARKREQESEPFLRGPVKLENVRTQMLFYDLGVDLEAREVLESMGEGGEHATYIERDIDLRLREEVKRAGEEARLTFIVLSGPVKSGKSRTLLEAACAVLPHGTLVMPKDGPSLAKLARSKPAGSPFLPPYVIWLDDVEVFVALGSQGLNPQTLADFDGWAAPVLVLATEGGKGLDLAGSDAARFFEVTADLLTRARRLRLPARMTAQETRRFDREYGGAASMTLGSTSIGELMIAVPRLIDRLERGPGSREGPAIVWAAIDCRRAGIVAAIPQSWLREIYQHYISSSFQNADFSRGLDWATTPLYSSTALLSRDDGRADDRYLAHDSLVQYAGRLGKDIPGFVWDLVLKKSRGKRLELTRIVATAYGFGEGCVATSAWREVTELLATETSGMPGVRDGGWANWLIRWIGADTRDAYADALGALEADIARAAISRPLYEALRDLLVSFLGPGEANAASLQLVRSLVRANPRESAVIEVFHLRDRTASNPDDYYVEDVQNAIKILRWMGEEGALARFIGMHAWYCHRMGGATRAKVLALEGLQLAEPLSQRDPEYATLFEASVINARSFAYLDDDLDTARRIEVEYFSIVDGYLAADMA